MLATWTDRFGWLFLLGIAAAWLLAAFLLLGLINVLCNLIDSFMQRPSSQIHKISATESDQAAPPAEQELRPKDKPDEEPPCKDFTC